MLACVLVIGEDFLEAVWKEADSSALAGPVAVGTRPPSELSDPLCSMGQPRHPHSRR